jgi:protein-disulfide isomerase
MKLSRWLILALLVLLAVPLAAQDQDQEGVTDYFARYAGIPTARLEDGGFVLGDPEAPITIVEFADFLCPHCQTYQETAHQFIEEYVATGKARFEYRLFPVVDPTYSAYGAALAECADEQIEGAFWPAHDLLYELGAAREIGPDSAATVAEALGLEQVELTLCAEQADQYVTDQAVGNAVGVSGTPATRVRLENGELAIVSILGNSLPSGGVPFNMLELIMAAVDINDVVVVPADPLIELVGGDPACAEIVLSCWNGLIMGETSWEEALELIENNAQFADIQTADDPDTGSSVIGWRFLTSQISDYSQAVSFDGTTIDLVALIELSPFSISEVFDNLGEPTNATVSVGSEEASFAALFYPERGLIVQVYVRQSEGGFNEFSQVIGAQYLSAERMAEILASFVPPAWEGFEAYESYLE